MKPLTILLVAIVLLPLFAHPQALPDNPAPAPAPDPAWDRVRNLTHGQPIIVVEDNRPPVHCLFSGATDDYLFCDPAGNPPGVGYRFDRASVISVDLDLPAQNRAHFDRPERNYHPAWIASILAGGLVVGICATRSMDDGDAARAGAIAALVVAVVGAPLAFLPQPWNNGSAYRPRNFEHARIPRFALHNHQLSRLASIR
jgi:uncharacterized membrane protein YeaQ/YmgE (transglycosylase-associated protein family)